MKYAAACLLALVLAACRPHQTIDAEMAACVPPEVLAAAHIDLDRLRASPLYARLPAAAHSLADTYRAAHRLLAAWDGSGILIVLQTREAPPGATVIAPDLALTGSPALVQAAARQHRTGKTGVPRLLTLPVDRAAPAPLWAVAQGGVALPLTGNFRNLNRLFRNLDYSTLSADPGDSLDLRLTAVGRSEPAARDFEQTLRGLISLATAAEARNPRLSALLASIQIHRTATTVTASLDVPAADLDALVQSLP